GLRASTRIPCTRVGGVYCLLMRSSIAPILSLLITCHTALPGVPPPFQGFSELGPESKGFAELLDDSQVTRGPAPEKGAVALDQVEKDLGNPFVVAAVAARPGDEDSAALVYCRKKLGAHTVAVFATRGEQIEEEVPGASPEETGVVRTCQALEVAAAE